MRRQSAPRRHAPARHMDKVAERYGWNFKGRTNQGHRLYDWTDTDGVYHVINVGSGTHSDADGILDAKKGESRIRNCINGKCTHVKEIPEGVEVFAEPDDPVISKGNTVYYKGRPGTVIDIADGIVEVVFHDDGSQDVFDQDDVSKTARIKQSEYDELAWHDLIEEKGDDAYLYHITNDQAVAQVFLDGLKPRTEHDQDFGWSGQSTFHTPREGYIYFADKETSYALSKQNPVTMAVPLPQIRVRMEDLDPSKVATDEDIFVGSRSDPKGLRDWREENAGNPDAFLYGLEPTGEEAGHYDSLGEWADSNAEKLDRFDYVYDSLHTRGTIAYFGSIPANQVELNPDWVSEVIYRIGTSNMLWKDKKNLYGVFHLLVPMVVDAVNSGSENEDYLNFLRVFANGDINLKGIEEVWPDIKSPKWEEKLFSGEKVKVSEWIEENGRAPETLRARSIIDKYVRERAESKYDRLSYDMFFEFIRESFPDFEPFSGPKKSIGLLTTMFSGDKELAYDRLDSIYRKVSEKHNEAKLGKSLMEWRTLEKESGLKESAWSDIMAKAKRLKDDGQVILLRNGVEHVVATVQGDHGVYETELQRQDPNSLAISGWNCFPPGTPITMGDGTLKAIELVRSGDRVVTHLGNIKSVLHVMDQPHTDEVVIIKMQGIDEEFISTPNHEVYYANHDFYREDLAGWKGKFHRGTEPMSPTDGRRMKPIPVSPEQGWKEAGDIVVGDYLSMTPSKVEIPFVFRSEVTVGVPKSSGSVYRDQICDIEIDEDMATLLGWYAAEGSCVKNERRVAFCLGLDELHVADLLGDIAMSKFGTRGTTRVLSDKSVIDYRFSDPHFWNMCNVLVGRGSVNKKLHEGLMNSPLNVQKAFLRAYSDGDGNIDINRESISTVSHNLANQVAIILARMGYHASFAYDDDNYGNGFVKNCRRIYKVRWTHSDTRQPGRFVKEGRVWYKVEDVRRMQYDGVVHNLEVEDDHSYQAFGVNVHNCQCEWAQYAWDRTRKFKRFEGRLCVVPGTLISMADGSFKPIEEVRPWDRVITHDNVGVVTEVMMNKVDEEIVDLVTEEDRRLSLTKNHEVFASFMDVEDTEPKWVDAGNLTTVHKLVTIRDGEYEYDRISDWNLTHYSGPVYNLKVDNQESYVANGIVVHNCSHALATLWMSMASPLDEEEDIQGPSPLDGVPPVGESPEAVDVPIQADEVEPVMSLPDDKKDSPPGTINLPGAFS